MYSTYTSREIFEEIAIGSLHVPKHYRIASGEVLLGGIAEKFFFCEPTREGPRQKA
jgi:hypothetical protein